MFILEFKDTLFNFKNQWQLQKSMATSITKINCNDKFNGKNQFQYFKINFLNLLLSLTFEFVIAIDFWRLLFEIAF
jgi:hypothetical protein